jgi:hypothetical protein
VSALLATPAASASTAVPEPATLSGAIIVAALSAIPRRRRRRRD